MALVPDNQPQLSQASRDAGLSSGLSDLAANSAAGAGVTPSPLDTLTDAIAPAWRLAQALAVELRRLAAQLATGELPTDGAAQRGIGNFSSVQQGLASQLRQITFHQLGSTLAMSPVVDLHTLERSTHELRQRRAALERLELLTSSPEVTPFAFDDAPSWRRACEELRTRLATSSLSDSLPETTAILVHAHPVCCIGSVVPTPQFCEEAVGPASLSDLTWLSLDAHKVSGSPCDELPSCAAAEIPAADTLAAETTALASRSEVTAAHPSTGSVFDDLPLTPRVFVDHPRAGRAAGQTDSPLIPDNPLKLGPGTGAMRAADDDVLLEDSVLGFELAELPALSRGERTETTSARPSPSPPSALEMSEPVPLTVYSVAETLSDMGQAQRPLGGLTQSIQDAARAALSLRGAARRERVEALVWLLLADPRRLPLAYHLVSLAERSSAPTQTPPAWLIKACLLATRAQTAKSLVTRELLEELQHFSLALITAGPPAVAAAMGLLLRGAAIIPAVIRPSRESWNVLRSFKLQSEQVQLYNLGARLIDFGHRNGQLDPVFHAMDADEALRRKQQLTDEARSWRELLVEASATYHEHVALYQRTGWSLRVPAITRSPGALAQWRATTPLIELADRVVAHIQPRQVFRHVALREDIVALEALLAKCRALPMASEMHPPSDLVRLAVQAISMGQAWLILQRDVPQDHVSSEAVTHLREDIARKAPAIAQELRQWTEPPAAMEERSAGQLLQQLFVRLQDIVAGVPGWDHDCEPEVLLNRDLLAIDGVALTADGRLLRSPADLETQLLSLLCEAPLSWTEMLQRKLNIGDYDGLLTLAAVGQWSPAQQQQVSSAVTQVRQARSDRLHCLADESREDLRLCREHGIVSAAEHRELDDRLSRLLHAAHDATQWTRIERELAGLQRQLKERREIAIRQAQQRLTSLSAAVGRDLPATVARTAPMDVAMKPHNGRDTPPAEVASPPHSQSSTADSIAMPAALTVKERSPSGERASERRSESNPGSPWILDF